MRHDKYGRCDWPTRERRYARVWTDDGPTLPALLRALRHPPPPAPPLRAWSILTPLRAFWRKEY
jgi:hypothetical protein